MSKADKIFKDLKYDIKETQLINDEEQTIVYKEIIDFKANKVVEIVFDFGTREIEKHYKNDETYYADSISLEELKAINEKIKELRW